MLQELPNFLCNSLAKHKDQGAKFLPPNVTSVIQPMDQGVLESMKRRYRKKLLHSLIIADEMGTSIIDFLKIVDMKMVIKLVAEAWDEISSSTLRRSWEKLYLFPLILLTQVSTVAMGQMKVIVT